MAKKLKIWNGASWEDVTYAISSPAINVTNTFSTNQIIDASTSVAALRITQRGTGEAFRVEDEANPDLTPFIINSDGLVGIGTTDFSIRSSTNSGSKIISNGGMVIVNYGSDSSITIARANGTSSAPTQVLANERIAFFIGSSYYTGATSGFNNNTAMNFHAAENITDTARGSFITFDTTNIGSVGRSEKMRITSDGNVGIGTSDPSGMGAFVALRKDQNSDTILKIYNGTIGASATARLDWSTGTGNSYVISALKDANGSPYWHLAAGSAVTAYYYDAPTHVFRNTAGTNKLEIQSGALKIWAGRNGALEGGEMYLVSGGGANTYSNYSDAVFDWYDGMVRLSPDGFNKIYYLRPANDSGTGGGIRNIAASTSNPSGGVDGDMWAVYV